MDLILDIETTPGQHPSVLETIRAEADAEIAAIKAPSNYKDPEKIAEYISVKRAEIEVEIDKRYRKTGLDGLLGQIAVIGFAIDDEYPIAIHAGEDWAHGESFVISTFFDTLKERFSPNDRFKFIGHNLIGFDLRFILHRSMLLGIKPPPFIPVNPRPWDEFVYDTMIQWAGVGNRVSLNRLSRAFGLSGKGDMDGSMVYDVILDGDIERVAEYCKEDVNLTRQIFNRMTFSGARA